MCGKKQPVFTRRKEGICVGSGVVLLLRCTGTAGEAVAYQVQRLLITMAPRDAISARQRLRTIHATQNAAVLDWTSAQLTYISDRVKTILEANILKLKQTACKRCVSENETKRAPNEDAES